EGREIGRTRLDAEPLQRLDARGPEVETDRLKTPFLRGEQQRAVAEADIEPGAVGHVARNTLDDARRDHAALLEGGARLLTGVGALEDLGRHFGREVAVGEDVAAGLATH